MLSKNDFKEKQIACVFLNQGEKLSFSNDNLVLKDIDGKIKLQTTCYRLFALLVIGSFTMTSGLIQRSKKFGFTIILLSHSFRPYACIPNGIQGNTQLRKAQYAYEGIDVAKCLVINKIENQALAIGRIKSSKSLCDETRTR